MKPDIDKARLLSALERVIGPAPWYWNTFPQLSSSNGETLVWRHHGKSGPLAYLVSLAPAEEPDRPRLALNTYCRPFAVPPRYLGIWCPEGRNLRLACFEPAALESFGLDEVAGWFKSSSERIYAVTPPVSEFEVPVSLESGLNPIEVPAVFQTVDELIAPTSYPARTKSEPLMCLYVFYLQAGLLEVLPQNWFTAETRNLGMEWITRAARDPESHLIFGDGVRIGSFLLETDGRTLATWLDEKS